MSDKVTLCILLAGFIYLPAVISKEISIEDREKSYLAFITEHYEECKHLVSEEIYEIMRDGNEIDNEETRAFTLCSFKAFQWMVNSEINVEQMLEDAPRMMDTTFTPPEIIAGRAILNYCKREAEENDDEQNIIEAFGNCAYDRIQADV